METTTASSEGYISDNEFIDMLLKCPKGDATGRGMMDDSLYPRLEALLKIEQPLRRVKLLEILDDCVFASLCSGLVIRLMDLTYRNMGGTDMSMDEDRKHPEYNSMSKEDGYHAP